MRKLFILLLLLSTIAMEAAEPGKKEMKVLVYSFNGEGYVHDNISRSVQAVLDLCKKNGILADTSSVPGVFESPELIAYDAIIFANTNAQAFQTDTQRKQFQLYIESGRAFMGIHSANTSEAEWDWFRRMIGGTFVRHPVLQSFDIHVIDDQHISTCHLPGIWKWEDECYFSDHLNPAIHVLLAVDIRSLEDDEVSDFPGSIFGDYFPLAWCHTFEESKVFFTALGHKESYYEDQHFLQHLEGGLKWILEIKK